MKTLLVETFKLIKKKEYNWIPANLAFYLLFSIIPLILTISLIVINYISTDLSFIREVFHDSELVNQANEFFSYTKSSFTNISFVALAILLLYTIWLSSRGVFAVMDVVSKFYGFNHHSYIKSRIIAYVVTIVIIITILVMFLFASIIPLILNLLHIKVSLFTVYLILPFIIFLVMYIIYLAVSEFELKGKDILKGTLFSTISIYLILLFSNMLFYNTRINLLFGSFAIVIVLSHLFYYISICLYLGLAMNVADYNLKKKVR